jgi:hypothetical protein
MRMAAHLERVRTLDSDVETQSPEFSRAAALTGGAYRPEEARRKFLWHPT